MNTTSQFYLAQAAQCGRDAEETSLANVRERYLLAQAAWQSMADRALKGERGRLVAEKR